jgi:hypothetical protein
MKKFLVIILILPYALINAQEIGEMAPEKAPTDFPDHAWGADLMFGEGGFGLGTFYRLHLQDNLTGFIDFSISESKDSREVEYVDIFGNTYSPGKKNRVFLLPLNIGIQYRLFSRSLTDNFRPYLSAGVGPTAVVYTPYDEEFFVSFAKAKAKYAAGGYIGLGANFGLSKKNLMGINFRYSIVHLFDKGVESLENSYRKDFGHFYLALNLGIMY